MFTVYTAITQDHSMKLHIRDPNYKHPSKQIPRQGKEETFIFATFTNRLEVPTPTSSGLRA